MCVQVLMDHKGAFDGLEMVSFHSTSKGIIGECVRLGTTDYGTMGFDGAP